MYSEAAIQNFYNWEIRGRGYLLYPYPVSIEPPFKRFYHYYAGTDKYIDDGIVPNLLKRLFSKREPVISKPVVLDEELPEYFEYNQPLKQLEITFSRISDIDETLFFEFLNMLSDSHDRISFELIANHQKLKIQLVCALPDARRIEHLIKEYFPEIIIKVDDLLNIPFNEDHEVLIVDFGYTEEFIRPINSSLNGLVGIMSVISHLRSEEIVIFQIIFKGVNYPWAESILHSVTIGKESFFPDSPEMLICAKEKISSPLFSVVIRLAVQASSPDDAQILATELIRNIKTSSRGEFNSLIPITNADYDFQSHYTNLNIRATNRTGMIMSTKELSSLVYFPNTLKLLSSDRKTKLAPESVQNNQYFLGINTHLGIERRVTLNDQQRLRHCHIIGATGTGKSTLITNLFLEDVKHGNGCVIFDPHGDTIDDIIPRIPENRLQDVILIDPSDSEYAFCINLLSAKTDVEKIVLSSDLVEAFRRHSTSWGDQMTSVLSNAINTFLDSSEGGTLIDLKRFLLEDDFRKEFLKTVNDITIHYYWNYEYPYLKKANIIPLLTRLDTFLRPKLIRNMLSHKEGLDFNEVLKNRKILLVKLSQGLIGRENSYLLGTIILSKIYQVAQARQLLQKEERTPFYIYLDEFQNFITPSINEILSGARKYGIGLILAHQDLNQIRDPDIYNSLLSNANIQICFRLGDSDARKLESGFSGFDQYDLQNLNIGEAIARVGRNTEDFSLNIFPLNQVNCNVNQKVFIENARNIYSKKISTSDEITIIVSKNSQEQIKKNNEVTHTLSCHDLKRNKDEYIEALKKKNQYREHKYLQTYIKKIAEQRGFKATIEQIIGNGRIDITLHRDSLKIACEIAIKNSIDYEVMNVLKCISFGYKIIYVIALDASHLELIKNSISERIKECNQLSFLIPSQLPEVLDSLSSTDKNQRLKGYRVRVNYTK